MKAVPKKAVTAAADSKKEALAAAVTAAAVTGKAVVAMAAADTAIAATIINILLELIFYKPVQIRAYFLLPNIWDAQTYITLISLHLCLLKTIYNETKIDIRTGFNVFSHRFICAKRL